MQYELSHGEAISLGMMFAAHLSEKMNAFTGLSSLCALLIKYGLPVEAAFSAAKVLQSLKMDKKRVRHSIDFVLLKRIGKSEIRAIPIVDLQRFLKSYA
jgi:3-dehydroquinate synthase